MNGAKKTRKDRAEKLKKEQLFAIIDALLLTEGYVTPLSLAAEVGWSSSGARPVIRAYQREAIVEISIGGKTTGAATSWQAHVTKPGPQWSPLSSIKTKPRAEQVRKDLAVYFRATEPRAAFIEAVVTEEGGISRLALSQRMGISLSMATKYLAYYIGQVNPGSLRLDNGKCYRPSASWRPVTLERARTTAERFLVAAKTVKELT